MRQIIIILLSVVLGAVLAGCEKPQSNGLMDGASPGTSAMAFYCYDGENVYNSYIYDSKTTRSILDKLDAVKAKEAPGWSLDDIILPVYGFWMGTTDGLGLFAAWSNNYWIAQDGAVYSFDFDFGKLREEYPWTDESMFASFTLFPNARLLVQDENGWNSMLLTPAEEPVAPDGVAMALDSWDENAVTVNITNNNDAEWMYGEHYTLQTFLDGAWYEIPPVPGHWGFNDVGLIVQGGETQEKTYDLTMYGSLPAGTYRLVAYGLSVENSI